jgi:hypothetical protein
MSEVAPPPPALGADEIASLRAYLARIRQSLEEQYSGATPAERQAHYRSLSDDLVTEALRHLEEELEDDDREVYGTVRSEIATLSWEIFRQEFGLDDDES